MGMRGTGSNDLQIDSVFVPAHRVGVMQPLAKRPPAYSGPLYGSLFWGIHGETIPSVAAAEAAVDAIVELSRSKIANFTARRIGEGELVQHHVGKARSLVGAAKAYLTRSISDAYEASARDGSISPRLRAECELAAVFSAQAAAQAVDLVHEAAGQSGFRQGQPFERHFRDVHTLTQHVSKSVHRYASVAKMELGLPQDFAFLDL
jgi:alkylation response protein AidB-like acyl-CoA dehydrogenase